MLNLKHQTDRISVWVNDSTNSEKVDELKKDIIKTLGVDEKDIDYDVFKDKRDAPKTEKKSPLRNWEAINGNKVEAEFVSISDGQVTLRKSTGQTFKVPLNKLSKADQDYISKNSKLLDKKE